MDRCRDKRNDFWEVAGGVLGLLFLVESFFTDFPDIVFILQGYEVVIFIFLEFLNFDVLSDDFLYCDYGF
jgi:hypothetical protein